MIPITPKGTLSEQASVMTTLKYAKVLLILNWRGLFVSDRESDDTKESNRLRASVISLNQFTMKVKDENGNFHTILFNGIDFIELVSAMATENAVTL